MNVPQLLQQAQSLRLAASDLIAKPAATEHRELETAGATATTDALIRSGAPIEELQKQLGVAKMRYEAAQKREQDLTTMCDRFSKMFFALSEAATSAPSEVQPQLAGEASLCGETYEQLKANLQTAMLETAAAAALAGVSTAVAPGSRIIRPVGFATQPTKLIIPGNART